MLFKCKECGGQVSDKAAACPHCGAPVESGVRPDAEENAHRDLYHLISVSEQDERLSERIRLDVEEANQILSLASADSPHAVAKLLSDSVGGAHRDHVAFGSLTFTVGCLKEFSGHSRAVLSRILSSAQELATALVVDKSGVDSFCKHYDVDQETASRILSTVHDYTFRRTHNKFLADEFDCVSICPNFLPTREGQYHFGRYVAVKLTRYIAYGCFIWAFFSAFGLVVCLFDPPSRKYLWGFVPSIPCAALAMWIHTTVSGTNKGKKK